MKPRNLHTKIFLDSGIPVETKEMLELLTFLDGQTTNPSLMAKNPVLSGKKFSESELYATYQEIASEISHLIPQGSVSLEVYADKDTSYEQMLEEGRKLNQWIPNAHIKLPITEVGLKVARTLVDEGINVNMTLCFTQEQAAAVYQATAGAKRGQVYVSPFIGRLEDIGLSGMSLVFNIEQMYREEGDGHVMVLAASIRSLEHVMLCLSRNIDIITSGPGVYKTWAEQGCVVPDETYQHITERETILYRSGLLSQSDLNIQHDLTDAGLQRFADDWNNLLKS